MCLIIVSRGDRLGNPVKIKVEDNGAVGYIENSLTVHNPLFSVHKSRLNKLMQSSISQKLQNDRKAIEHCAR